MKLTLLQIEESRKAIQQAETVRRLTILAFVFIPLSTVCGAFGMNLRELGSDTPAWVFGVSAASVVIATSLLAVGPTVMNHLIRLLESNFSIFARRKMDREFHAAQRPPSRRRDAGPRRFIYKSEVP